MEKNIGIDFGTTNTIIYTRDSKGTLKKIGGKSIKSAVYFISRNEYIIGEDAIRRAVNSKYSTALVTDFKPKIAEKIPITAENGEEFQLKGTTVSRCFMNKIFTDYVEVRFRKFFGIAETNIADKTIITVPAKFDADKKTKIKRAANNAMFPNVGIAFEPTAAAIAASELNDTDDIIAVYDFGGGTFDVSVIAKNRHDHFEAIEEDGDPDLGGNRITEAVAEKLIIPILNDLGVTIYIDHEDMDFDDEDCMTEEEYITNIYTINSFIETLKEAFSEGETEYVGKINIVKQSETTTYELIIDKDSFEQAIEEPVRKTVEITRRVVERVQKRGYYIRKIIMAGGSSQLLPAERLLREEFEYDGIEVVLSDNVFDLIAKGALLMAEHQKIIRVEEKTTSQFGVGVRTGIGMKKFDMLIDIGEMLPVSGSKRFVLDKNNLDTGAVDIPCYEKDVKNFPDAVSEYDDGILHINTYRIPIDRRVNPAEIEVTFTIEKDGALNLSAKLLNKSGVSIAEINSEIMADSEVE